MEIAVSASRCAPSVERVRRSALALAVFSCALLAGCKALRPDPVYFRAYTGNHRPDAEIARLLPVGQGQRITRLNGVALPTPVAQGGYGLEVLPGPLTLTVEFSYGAPFTYCPPNTICSYGKGEPLLASFVAEPGRTYHVGREFPEKGVWRIHITDAASGAVVPTTAILVSREPAAAPTSSQDPLTDRRHDIAQLDSGDALDAARAAERLGAAGRASAEALPALERFVAQATPTRVVVNWSGSSEFPIGTTVESPLIQLRAIARIGGCERLRALLPTATDTTRWMFYQSFGFAAERCAARELIAAIRNGSSEESKIAAWSVGRLREAEAVPALLAATAEYDGLFSIHRRLAYIDALGAIGDPRAVEPLIALTDEKLMGLEATGITQPVAAALKKITGMDFSTDTAAWRRWWESVGRQKLLPAGR